MSEIQISTIFNSVSLSDLIIKKMFLYLVSFQFKEKLGRAKLGMESYHLTNVLCEHMFVNETMISKHPFSGR